MKNIHNDNSFESKNKNASHDQSRHSAFLASEKSKYMKDDKGDDADPRESLKEAFDFAKRLLIDGQPQQASDKCMKALKDANEIFGENSAETLPGYFILAEANIEEGKLKRAEDFLIGAYWNLLKHSQDEKQASGGGQNAAQKGEVLNEKDYMAFKGTLHKVFAKLYSAKREYDRAMDELKNGIYIDSCHYGPEDIQTSISYFNFGEILIKSNDYDKGYCFYNQAVKIWYKFFKALMRNYSKNSGQVDDIIIKQGLSALKGIEEAFAERARIEGEDYIAEDLYRLNYALAFMHKYIGEEDVAMEHCRNVEAFLMNRYQEGHNKLNRFYKFFPNYQNEEQSRGEEEEPSNRNDEGEGEDVEEEGEEGERSRETDPNDSRNQNSYD